MKSNDGLEKCIDCGAVKGDSHGMVDCVAVLKTRITGLWIELKCERALTKQMRQMAYDARAKVSTMIYSVEQLAISDENRVAEMQEDDDV